VKYVFGPVPSRRLGNSLGVDLLTFKACTFDCVYCQLGRTTEQTTERRSFVPADEVVAEVREVLASGNVEAASCRFESKRLEAASTAAVDCITLSGSGEPTLSLDLGKVIRAIKGMTRIPVAVITNGSLLWREDVRADLAEADIVVPSLDAARPETFERVNRARGVEQASGLLASGTLAPQLDVATIAGGIRDFTLGFGGRVWLEVLVVAGVNDSVEEAEAIVRALEGARIDKVQLNTVVRAPAEAWAKPASEACLAEMAKVLEALAPVDIIGTYARAGHESRREDGVGQASGLASAATGTVAPLKDAILATLARRPCGADELAASLGLDRSRVVQQIQELERAGAVERVLVGGQAQYRPKGTARQ